MLLGWVAGTSRQSIFHASPRSPGVSSLRRVVMTVFSFRTKEQLTKQRIKEEVVRKARHVLKGAALAA